LPRHDCSDSGCCASPAQRCFEKNSTHATCMDSCNRAHRRFVDWTCMDRAKRLGANMAPYGSVIAPHEYGSSSSRLTEQMVLEAVLGSKLTELSEDALGADGRSLLLLLLTIGCGCICCVLYVVGRYGGRACRSYQRVPTKEAVLPPVPIPAPVPVAAEHRRGRRAGGSVVDLRFVHTELPICALRGDEEGGMGERHPHSGAHSRITIIT
jgi:hypothetical protein